MKRYPFLELGGINARYARQLRNAATRVIDSGRYIGGEENRDFERNFSAFIGAGCEAVGCGNGYDALFLILRAYMELGRLTTGDEVIIPANTFIATVLSVINAGLKPILVDPDPDTMNLSGEIAARALTPRTRAVITVHLYGSPAWDEEMLHLATDKGIFVIEDAAQAIGASALNAGISGGFSVGSLGHAAAFSFYPTKNLGALGDGGAMVSSDTELCRTVRQIANYGSDTRNHYRYLGVNSRLDSIHAAMLSDKLKDLPETNNRRRQRATLYGSLIDNPLVRTPYNPGSVWHQYVVRIGSGRRDDFRNYMASNGVETDIHYPVPPHRQPCLSYLTHAPLSLTEALASEIVSLPISDCTSLDDVIEISAMINNFK